MSGRPLINGILNIMKGALCEWEEQKCRPEAERCSIRTLARPWVLSYATFAQTHRVGCHHSSCLHQSDRPTVLGKVAEAELPAQIRSLTVAGFILTRVEVRILAYENAVANGIGRFSAKSSIICAGYYWLEGFTKRHSEVSVQKAEYISTDRAMARNRPQVMAWFQKFHGLVETLE